MSEPFQNLKQLCNENIKAQLQGNYKKTLVLGNEQIKSIDRQVDNKVPPTNQPTAP